jgi:hypothetical protein
MRISAGNLLVGTTVTGRAAEGADRFTIADASHSGMTIRSGVNAYGSINFSDSEGGAGEYAGSIWYGHGTLGEKLVMAIQGSNKVTVDGDGLKFNNDTAAANALNDYEEGIFSLVAQGSGYTLGTNSGFYTKVGRQVTLQYMFGFTAVGGNNSSCTFTGIPFASANLLAGTCQSGALRENTNTGAIYVANVQNNNTQFEINSMDGVGSAKQRTLRANETYCATVTYFTT